MPVLRMSFVIKFGPEAFFVLVFRRMLRRMSVLGSSLSMFVEHIVGDVSVGISCGVVEPENKFPSAFATSLQFCMGFRSYLIVEVLEIIFSWLAFLMFHMLLSSGVFLVQFR